MYVTSGAADTTAASTILTLLKKGVCRAALAIVGHQRDLGRGLGSEFRLLGVGLSCTLCFEFIDLLLLVNVGYSMPEVSDGLEF